MDNTEVPTSAPETTTFSRDQIRAAVLDAKSDDVILTVFGVQIEVRTPDLESLIQYRNAQDDDTVMARSIVNHCYVPGTNEKVFEDADIDVLMHSKFSPDMKRLVAAINKVLGGEELEAQINEETFPDTPE